MDDVFESNEAIDMEISSSTVNGACNEKDKQIESDKQVIEEPKVGMSFGSQEEAFDYYLNYAKQKGFGIFKRTSKRGDDGNLKYFTFSCAKSRKTTSATRNILKAQLSSKTGCEAKMRLKLHSNGNVEVTTVHLVHDHQLSPGKVRHFRCNKKLDGHVKRRLEINDQAGINVSKNFHSFVVQAHGYENLTFGEKDCRNYIDKARRMRLGASDAEAICNYFIETQYKDPNFFYATEIDDDCRLKNLFWADGRSRAAYKDFGDVITFDTTYLTNKYDMPFAPFVGVNHHGQSILLGCGLLTSENTQSFVWLFQSWLKCMSSSYPKAIITDQCKAMQNAIEIVFPESRHRWCLWHILKKVPEKLRSYAEYEEIKSVLENVIYDSLTIDDFEEGWALMIEGYNLYENDWLQGLYSERKRWIPAYVKDSFWAGMSTTQRSESINAFFDGYVNSKTTLKQFVEQYDNAMKSKVEKENLADYHSFNSWYECISNYEFEKQFQQVYTNAKFKEFQEELKEKIYCYPSMVEKNGSIHTYEVAEDVKFGDKRKDIIFTVNFNEVEFEINCKCCLFNFRGVLCRHALCVLTLRKVEKIPPRYILARWRKDLKRRYSFVKSIYNNSSRESLRYEKMCSEFHEIAVLAADDEEKYENIMKSMLELKGIIGTNGSTFVGDRYTQVKTSGSEDVLNHNGSPIKINKVLSPLVTRRKGRPPTKRRVSKLEQVIQKLKEKRKAHQPKETIPKKSRKKVKVGRKDERVEILSAENSTQIFDDLRTPRNVDSMVDYQNYFGMNHLIGQVNGSNFIGDTNLWRSNYSMNLSQSYPTPFDVERLAMLNGQNQNTFHKTLQEPFFPFDLNMGQQPSQQFD